MAQGQATILHHRLAVSCPDAQRWQRIDPSFFHQDPDRSAPWSECDLTKLTTSRLGETVLRWWAGMTSTGTSVHSAERSSQCLRRYGCKTGWATDAATAAWRGAISAFVRGCGSILFLLSLSFGVSFVLAVASVLFTVPQVLFANWAIPARICVENVARLTELEPSFRRESMMFMTSFK